MPIGYLFLLIFLWFGVSVPLVFVGSYLGYKKPAHEHPVRTNIIARGVPPQVRELSSAEEGRVERTAQARGRTEIGSPSWG